MVVKKFNPMLGISQGQFQAPFGHGHVVRPKAFFFDDDYALCLVMPMFSSDLRHAIDDEMKSTCGSAPFHDMVGFSIIVQLTLGMKACMILGSIIETSKLTMCL